MASIRKTNKSGLNEYIDYTRITFVIFLLSVVGHSLILINVGRPSHPDEVFFKAAGLSWSKGGPWAASEETGFFKHLNTVDLQDVFFSYPPGYPFLFGVFVKAFGFGWRTCVAFDAFVHIILLLVLAYFFKLFSPITSRHRWLLCTMFILINHPGRPDELAMLLGYMGLTLAYIEPPRKFPSISDIFFGLCAAVSVPCIMIIGAIRCGQILFSEQPFINKVQRMLILFATVAILWLTISSPIILTTPGALELNIKASLVHIDGGFFQGLQMLLKYHLANVIPVALFFLVGLLMLPKNLSADLWRQWSSSWLLPILIWGFFFSRNTFQGYYYIIWMPWLVAAILKEAHQRWPSHIIANKVKQRAVLALLALVLAIPSLQQGRHLVISLLAPQIQSWAAESERLQSLIPEDARVLTSDHWWSIAHKANVKDTMIMRHLTPQDIDYIVMTARGSGIPGKHQPLSSQLQQAVGEGKFYIISDNLDRERPTLLGIPLSNSAWGAGAVVYKAAH